MRDGDEWVVNGQKVWTTLAHTARWGLLVARTDPDVPKHRGLTYFVVDMHAPGVDVRPLRQITGDAEFNEVFFTDVRIPDTARLDAVGAGWRVATTTLMNERVAIGGGVPARSSGVDPRGAAHLAGHARGARRPTRTPHDPVGGGRGGRASPTCGRAPCAGPGRRGPRGRWPSSPGPSSTSASYELCVDLLGMEGTLYPTHYEMRRPDRATFSGGSDVRHTFLRSRANSIEGGTSEIMRNILGERVLGLPGEPRQDKDLPWAQIPATSRPVPPAAGTAQGRPLRSLPCTSPTRWSPGACDSATSTSSAPGTASRDCCGRRRSPPAPVPSSCSATGHRARRAEDYIVALARRLVRHHDLVAVAIDGPVHGDRRADGGSDSNLAFLDFAQVWSAQDDLIDDMVADWRATLDAVQALPEVSEGRCGYWGLSMGTIFGLPLTAAEPRIAVAVLGLMGIAGPTKARFAADAPNVHCPVLYLVQWDDELFDRDRSFELFESLASTDKRLHAHPGMHAEVPAEEFEASGAFLGSHLTL